LKRKSSPNSAAGKIAITHLVGLEKFASCQLIECRLETGRTHQIRVHCESIGHPIVGEQLYSQHPVARKMFDRQALHAKSLSFTDRESGLIMEFHADLPEDFQQLLARI
ncbi:MAG: RluA family pseudouridine synthase, partial [Gammaproteobacteria bacterium]|nr:RluA family pseudouridine synthase [Gammaproteobacteria bacterium]